MIRVIVLAAFVAAYCAPVYTPVSTHAPTTLLGVRG